MISKLKIFVLAVFFSYFSDHCRAEPIFYGASARRVEINATAATLLKFTSPPLSVSCQPEGLQFDTLKDDRLSVDEANNLRKYETVDAPKSPSNILSNFLRLRPIRRAGETTCSFSLRDGSTVSVVFELIEGLARPLIEFSPIASKFGLTESSYSAIDLFRGLISGESLGLHEITDDSQLCAHRAHRERCRNFSYETDSADYEITYAGTNGAQTAFTVRVKLKKDRSFRELADLKSSDGIIAYSLLLPQKEAYQAGETVTHYIVASPSVTKDDIKGVSP